MQKDVIYIDVEDDITAIIGKVKASKEKIIALVPPKRIGVLQSAVNLRLLSRAAEQNDKRLVLITSNQALMALAAAASLPIAKTLQSKPEVPEIPALEVTSDDGEDIIDGAQLPVGDHAKTAAAGAVSAAMAAELGSDKPAFASPPKPGDKPVKPRVTGKVPNFSKFRKKIFIFGGLGAFALVFLIWAIFFAGHATIVIAAKTTNASVNTNAQLGPTLTTDAEKNTIKSIVNQIKKDSSVEFDATGKKDVGDKATGSMKVTRTSVSSSAISIPAGTTFTSGTIVFVSTESATLGGTTIGPGGIVQPSATVSVQAANIGEEYNLSARAYSANVSGFDSTGSQMTGGTKRQATIVTASDIQKATEQLAQDNSDEIKRQLEEQFAEGDIVISESFTITKGDVVSTPAVDQELASGKAKLTSNVTYVLTGIGKSELDSFLTKNLESQIKSEDDQRVYSTGIDSVTFNSFTTNAEATRVTVVATGQVGPRINEQEIKDSAKGKRYGEVQQSIEAIQGVNDVDVRFWPFWVRSVPTDVNRISVEFKLDEQ